MKYVPPRPDRTIYIVGEITEAMAARVIPELERLDSTEGGIRIVLNSEGGHEQAGYSIYDAITMCSNEVTIDGYGSVMSIAAAIFQAGDVRRMAPNALFMIHNGDCGDDLGDSPTQDSVIAWSYHLKKFNKRYYNILSLGSTHPPDVIEKWCLDETYLTARETVSRCFADCVIAPQKSRVPAWPRLGKKKTEESP